MMSGYRCYLLYTRLKAHFKTAKFDFFRYASTNAGGDSYRKRNDASFFAKLAKIHRSEDSMREFLVSQLRDSPDMWIGEMVGEEAERRHLARIRSVESMTHSLVEATRRLSDETGGGEEFFRIFVVPPNGVHPRLLSLLLQRKISVETFLCYEEIVGFCSIWDARMREDIMWQDIGFRARKYRAFIHIDAAKIKRSIRPILVGHTVQEA